MSTKEEWRRAKGKKCMTWLWEKVWLCDGRKCIGEGSREWEEKEKWEGCKREWSGKRRRSGRGVRGTGVGREGEVGGVWEGMEWEEKEKREGCKRKGEKREGCKMEGRGKRRRSGRGVRGKEVGREG
jgi:hypothetical protein